MTATVTVVQTPLRCSQHAACVVAAQVLIFAAPAAALRSPADGDSFSLPADCCCCCVCTGQQPVAHYHYHVVAAAARLSMAPAHEASDTMAAAGCSFDCLNVHVGP